MIQCLACEVYSLVLTYLASTNHDCLRIGFMSLAVTFENGQHQENRLQNANQKMRDDLWKPMTILLQKYLPQIFLHR